MARVYTQTSQPILPDKPKGPRRWLPVFRLRLFPRSCLGRLVAWLVIIVFCLGALTAYLGIVYVPFFTPIFYRPIEPNHSVEINSEERDNIGQVLGKRMINQATNRNQAISLSESELTILLQKALIEAQGYPLENLQASISENGIEFYGILTSENRPYHFRLLSQPQIVTNEIKFKIVQANFEKLPLPTPVADIIVGYMFKVPLEILNREFTKYIQVAKIETQTGSLTLTGKIINSNIPF